MKIKLPLLLLTGVCFSIIGHSQTLASKDNLEVLTWNLEWFGSDNEIPKDDKGPDDEILQMENASTVLNKFGNLDVIAFQEICDEQLFKQLAEKSNYNYYISPGKGGYQEIGMFYSKELEVVESPKQILVDQKYQFSYRPPVIATFKHETVGEFTIIAIHLKAHRPSYSYEDNEKSYNRRKKSSEILAKYIHDNLDDEKVIIVGDWNDDVDISNFNDKPTPFAEMLSDESFRFTSMFLSYSFNESSKYGNVIDHVCIHVCISDELFPYHLNTSITGAENIIKNYIKTTSDHFPVVAVFGE